MALRPSLAAGLPLSLSVLGFSAQGCPERTVVLILGRCKWGAKRFLPMVQDCGLQVNSGCSTPVRQGSAFFYHIKTTPLDECPLEVCRLESVPNDHLPG